MIASSKEIWKLLKLTVVPMPIYHEPFKNLQMLIKSDHQ